MSVGRGGYLLAVGVHWVGALAGIAASVVLSRWALLTLGPAALGSWYMLLQGVGLLAVLDLGALALGPRDVAAAAGSGGEEAALEAARARRAQLLRQWPLLALGAALLFILLGSSASGVNEALATLFVGSFLLYPLRYAQVVLQGLNDQAWLGVAGLVGTLLGAALGIAGLEAGLGLTALALGWSAQQVAVGLMALGRVLWRHGPRWLRGPGSPPPLLDGRGLMASGSALVHTLFTGTDVLITGSALGAQSAAALGATSRLPGLASILGGTMTQLGVPPLARAHGAGGLPATVQETVLLGWLVGSATGSALVGAAALNRAFVGAWLQDSLYAGAAVTVALAWQVVVRQVLTSIVFGLLAAGRDRLAFGISAVETGVFVVAVPLLLGWSRTVLAVPLCQLVTGLVGLVVVVALFARGAPREVRRAWRRGWVLLVAGLVWTAGCVLGSAWAGERLEVGPLGGLALGSLGAVVHGAGACILGLSFPSTGSFVRTAVRRVAGARPGGAEQ